MPDIAFNKYRAAVDILQRGRDLLVDSLAEDVIDQADDLLEGGFLLNEFLESQGTRLHFLSLLVAQLEQSAEQYEEEHQPPAPPPPPVEPTAAKKRKPRSRKLQRQASPEGTTEDT